MSRYRIQKLFGIGLKRASWSCKRSLNKRDQVRVKMVEIRFKVGRCDHRGAEQLPVYRKDAVVSKCVSSQDR